jgi:hypothetical protein
MLKILWKGAHRAELKNDRGVRAKLVTAMSKMKPVMNKLRPESAVCFCGAPSTNEERIPGYVGPDLVSPLVLCLQEHSMAIESNFFAKARNIV